MTPYNVRNAIMRGDFAGRWVVKDPADAATVNLYPGGNNIIEVTSSGSVSILTLQSASRLPLGTEVMVTNSGTTITVEGVNIADGEFAIYKITKNTSNGNVWTNINSTALVAGASGAAPGVSAFDIPIGNNWRAPTALHTNLAATDSAGILGLETVAMGASQLNVTTATPSSATFSARCNTVVIPADYSAGTDLTLTVTADETVAATTATLDALVYEAGDAGSDICATAAQSIIGAAPTAYDFTITGTDLVPGDALDIRLDVLLDDVAATPEYDLTKVSVSYTTAY